MYSDVVKLIKRSFQGTDKYGNSIHSDTSREVFAQCKSISMKEYYEASTKGFKPELKVIMSDYYDYDNEDMLEYEGIKYDIYRIYRSSNSVELTCQRSISDANT